MTVLASRLPLSRPAGPLPAVLIVSGSVGAGHDGAARELAARLRRAGVQADVHDYLDGLPVAVQRLLRDGYTISVGRVPVLFEWLFQALERLAPARMIMRAVCRLADRQVLAWTRQRRYGLVVSTYPLASQSLGRLRRQGRLAVPVTTYLTDPAAHRSWLHPGVDEVWSVTTATARQAWEDYRALVTAAGPLVPPAFAVRPAPTRRRALRAQLGVPDAATVALVVTGSLGLGDVEQTAADLAAAGVVPLVLCGRNAALRRRLAATGRCVALGWRDDVPDLMAASDVLVHNAGGLSFTEAYVAGLPAVSYRCIPGHGQANARVLEQSGIAPWARDPSGLADVLRAPRRGAAPPHRDPADLVLQRLAAGQPSPTPVPVAA